MLLSKSAYAGLRSEEAISKCGNDEDFAGCLEEALAEEEISELENKILKGSDQPDEIIEKCDVANPRSTECSGSHSSSSLSSHDEILSSISQSDSSDSSCLKLSFSSGQSFGQSTGQSMRRSILAHHYIQIPGFGDSPKLKLFVRKDKLPLIRENKYELFIGDEKRPYKIEGKYNPSTWELTLTPPVDKVSVQNFPQMISVTVDPDLNIIYNMKVTLSMSQEKYSCTRCELKSVHYSELKNSFNGGVVIPNVFYRSGYLGNRIKNWETALEKAKQKPPETYVSMHVLGYDEDNEERSYNLKEMEYAHSKNKKFIHAYGDPEAGEFAYIDGRYAANVPEKDFHRGNIYKEETLHQYIPSAEIRKKLGIDKMREKYQDAKSVYNGDLDGLLTTLDNVVSAPWPVSFHCKGGRHKTGILVGAIRCLQGEDWWYNGPKVEINVWSGFDSLMNWEVLPQLLSRVSSLKWHKVSLSPAEKEYTDFNPAMYRSENIAFMDDLCRGRLFERQEQLEKWIKIKRKLDEKLAMNGLASYSCISPEDFENRYRITFKNRSLQNIKDQIVEIQKAIQKNPREAIQAAGGATGAKYLKDTHGEIRFIVKPYRAAEITFAHSTVQRYLPRSFNNFSYSAHNEIFVSRLAEILSISEGLVPKVYFATMTVNKKEKEPWIIIEFKKGKKSFAHKNSGRQSSDFRESLARLKNEKYRKEVTEAVLFSLLIGNVDLHPENILVNENKELGLGLTLIDFGLTMPTTNKETSEHKRPVFSELGHEMLDRKTIFTFAEQLLNQDTWKRILMAISESYNDVSVRGDILKAFESRALYLIRIRDRLMSEDSWSPAFEEVLKPLDPFSKHRKKFSSYLQ